MAERNTAGQHSSEAITPRGGVGTRLELCPCCDSGLVYPLDWEPAEPGHWRVGLRCPDCEWLGGGVYGQKVVDAFDEVLDDGTEALLAELTLMTRANLEEEIQRFVDALQRGLILPEDF
jgi:hypothetical protein